nr:hypothetical protein [Tanacetum cinerariifolium]
VENLRRRNQEVLNVCDDKKSRDTDQEDEREEVHMEDVKMDENHNVYNLKTNEELQWILQQRERGMLSPQLMVKWVAAIKELRCSWVPRLRRS